MRLYNAVFSALMASAMATGKLGDRKLAPSTRAFPIIDPPPPLAQTVRTEYVNLNGTKLAYRRFGKPGGSPIIYFNHLRATMDVTDPLLFNYIAQYREVILFDNSGVGHSEGVVSTSIENMAENAVGLINALGIKKVVAFGFSLGGGVAQYISWEYPELVEKAVFSGTQSGVGPGVAASDPSILEVAAEPSEPTEEVMLYLFFSPTETSLAAGHNWFQRRTDRRVRGEKLSGSVLEPGTTEQLTAISAFSSNPDNFARLQDIKVPVLVTNGKDDIMQPTVNSFILQQQLPYADLHIYPDSGHGHLFQFPKAYAEALRQFLDG